MRLALENNTYRTDVRASRPLYLFCSRHDMMVERMRHESQRQLVGVVRAGPIDPRPIGDCAKISKTT